MILIDENKLTYGTLSMIGQDYGVQGLNTFDLKEYADKVINILEEEERKYYKTNNCVLEIKNIVEDNRKEEVLDKLRDLIAQANGYNFKK